MGNKLYNEESIQSIANAIRSKNGSSDTYKVNEMATAISNIPSAKEEQTKSVTITENGTTTVTPDTNKTLSSVSITTNVSGGSTDVPFEFGGMNAQLVASFDKSWTLADTSFVIGSSSSSTATSIKAAESNLFTSDSLYLVDKDIIVVQTCTVTPTHSSSATKKAYQEKYAYVYTSWFSKRKTTDTSNKTTRQVLNSQSFMYKYYNTTGSLLRAQSSYGLYMTPSAPTLGSSTASSTPIKISSPVLYYRASSSYESTTNIKLVTACDFEWHVDVYSLDKFTTPVSAINDRIDAVLTGTYNNN